ncbi:MAG: ChaN family lipoprotein [Pseudomonadota bacterium]
MNRYYMILVFFLIIPIMQSCIMTTTGKPAKRSDPLIGQIIESKTGRPVDFQALIDHIATYDVIYLSEKHDNPDQHAFQQKVIQALVEKGITPSIGFEFFSMDNTPDLLNFIDSGQISHSPENETFIEKELRMKLGWHDQSDTMWQYYYDLLKLAKTKKLAVAGIDLSSALKKRITRKGIDSITPIEKELIFSTSLPDNVYKEHMFSIFKAVHCGMSHDRMQSRLYDTWVARNDKMALSITQMHTHGNGPVVVIVGGGHTEYNLGIIDRVSTINKQIRQVNIALTEITVNPSPLSDYLFPLDLKGYDATPPADFLWFTQRVSYENPCEKFKQSLEKMKAQTPEK